MLILSGQAKVVGGIEDKEDEGFPGIPQVGHALQGMGVLTGEAIEVPNTPLYQEHQEKKTDQHGQEEVWGWRSICWPARMRRPKMQWLTICGSGN